MVAAVFLTFTAIMTVKRWSLLSGLLLVVAILIHLLSANTDWVEYQYARGIYPSVSGFLRYLFAWIPFSLGDILYGLIGIGILWQTYLGLLAIYKKQVKSKDLKTVSLKVLIMLLLMYVLFNALWGINYNRKGIATQLGLPVQKYTAAELVNINLLLLIKTNESKTALLIKNDHNPISREEIFRSSSEAYKIAARSYPFLVYPRSSVKSSIWGWFGNYAGFTGYYNPFTGEAQVNTTIPKFLQPFTTCHEIAHQLGYAKENEANFVGYLAATASGDPFFHYSVYLDLFLYANRNLYNIDSTKARSFVKELLPAVKGDLQEWREFNLQHKSRMEPVIRWLYGKYLESNQQPSGVLSYDEVTGLLIAYYKKSGKI